MIGDPGSGKSSFAKRVFRDECHRALNSPATARLPVLLELKSIEIPKNVPEEGLGTWFYNHLRSHVIQNKVYKMDETFDNYVTTSGLLVILDGLDEVSGTDYPRMKVALNSLSERLRQNGVGNLIVLSMRTQFHRQVGNDFLTEFPHVMSIEPFPNSDVYEFLTRWPFAASAQDNISRIYEELTDRPTLREMCLNPLVLAMYVAQDQTEVVSVF